MDNETVVILDCSSTSSNYIRDIRDEGLTPILMEFPVPDNDRVRVRKLHDFFYSLNGDPIPEIVSAGCTYEETLKMTRKLEPVLILAGSDRAIEWTTRLASDLRLPSNDPKNLPQMQDKYLMQVAISKKGIRSIRSCLARTYEEASCFFDTLQTKCAVVKPIMGKATIGVCVCDNKTELKDAVKYNLSLIKGSTSQKDPAFLVQEYIKGTEYVINTASCNKEHIVTSAMKYDKILVHGRGRIYNYVESISPSCEEMRGVADYTFSVLDALGVIVGPVHTEIMVDEKGPVLIEVNCRPCGGLMKRSWLDKFLGHHETNIYLDSYLHQEKFKTYPKMFEPISNGIIKPIIVPYTISAEKNRLNEICSKLKSFDYELDMGGGRTYDKTIDFSSNGGFVYLCHEDKNVIMEDCLFIHQIETLSPELIFEPKFL